MANRWIKAGVGLALGLNLAAQCSDNGVCGLERPGSIREYSWGVTHLEAHSGDSQRIHYQTLRVEGRFPWGEATTLLFSLPFHQITGPLGSQAGVGDLTAVLDRSIWKGRDLTFSGQVGGRFGTGRSNGDPLLPQAYQTGLGSVDGLLGLRLSGAVWVGGLGYQMAGGRSENAITRLKRGDDVLAWVEYQGKAWGGNFSLKGNVIKRLQQSSVLNPIDGKYISLSESDFTQANLAGIYSWPLRDGWNLDLGASVPLLSRKSNEDGSKRSLTVQLGIRQRF